MDNVIWEEVRKALKYCDPEAAKFECAKWVRHCQGYGEYGPLRIFLLAAGRFLQMGEPQEALAYSAEATRLLSSLRGMGPNEREACIGIAGGLDAPINELIQRMESIQSTAVDSLRESISDTGEFHRTCDECRRKFTFKKSGCFIATAAYGTDSNENVLVLSDFRDLLLLRFTLGRLFVKAYYCFSPPLAALVRKNAMLALFIRVGLLGPVSRAVRHMLRRYAKRNRK